MTEICTQCGSSLEPEKAAGEDKSGIKCPVCGEMLHKDAKFCGHCGSSISPQQS